MVGSYVCTLQSMAKGDCSRKVSSCQCTSALSVFLKINVEIKGHFDFGPLSLKSRTQPVLWDAGAVQREGA